MGASIKKRRRRRKKDKRQNRLHFKDRETQSSFVTVARGRNSKNADRQMRAMGIVADPNRIKTERAKRMNQIRGMLNLSKSAEKTNDDDNVDIPVDVDTIASLQENEEPLGLNLPDTALKHKLTMALNTKPVHLKVKLARYKREYLQRLINKYGHNYAGMHTDIQLNFLQWTENTIRRDIEHFRLEFRFGRKNKAFKAKTQQIVL
eukprot:CAMPEP_0202712284 /NCGR_PEP_ID=MMETSP1385-20130828/36582_1 /ASSEMBLY_ACC=CAM_ASM_000861 /TAXON_ID=933848 /ORGANISM="Elphidium margaritaceum" /LENGTH=204 /DNA_ID=CAMNT_0049372267 /DNA_START=47 /DNA_END=661 /DNA_ORIENTATION=+